MKKRIVSLLLMLCVAMSALGLASCNLDMDIENPFSEGEGYVYDAEKVQQNMDRLTASGYKITIRYLETDNASAGAPESQSGGFSIAADGNLWYCEQTENGETTTVIMDFSGDTDFVTYTKSGDMEKWEKTTAPYEYLGGKEAAKSLYMNTYLQILTNHGTLASGMKEKGSVTVAGRACTKYELSLSAFGASYSNEYCIDNETGLCLKNAVAVGSIAEGSASASYECTAFEVGYRITLPAESDCITEEQDENNE